MKPQVREQNEKASKNQDTGIVSFPCPCGIDSQLQMKDPNPL